jgi:hypothetical protein
MFFKFTYFDKCTTKQFFSSILMVFNFIRCDKVATWSRKAPGFLTTYSVVEKGTRFRPHLI